VVVLTVRLIGRFRCTRWRSLPSDRDPFVRIVEHPPSVGVGVAFKIRVAGTTDATNDLTPTLSATALFDNPSAANDTIRAR
jgi:hypothetical protein